MSMLSTLSEPFVLANGKRITTLQDAADLILRLPKSRQSDIRWVQAAETLLRAADHPFPHQFEKANLALWRALRAEGLLARADKQALV